MGKVIHYHPKGCLSSYTVCGSVIAEPSNSTKFIDEVTCKNCKASLAYKDDLRKEIGNRMNKTNTEHFVIKEGNKVNYFVDEILNVNWEPGLTEISKIGNGKYFLFDHDNDLILSINIEIRECEIRMEDN